MHDDAGEAANEIPGADVRLACRPLAHSAFYEAMTCLPHILGAFRAANGFAEMSPRQHGGSTGRAKARGFHDSER